MQMKAWMMAGLLLAGSSMTKAQTSSTVKDDLFAGTEKFATNASSVTEVDMDPDSLNMVNGHNEGRARRTVLSVVHTYTYDKPGMYNMADVDAYRNKLNTGDWHCSVHVREMKTGESTDVCRKHRTDDLEETAIITVEPKSLTFIHRIQRPAPQGSSKPGGSPEALVMPSLDYGMFSDGMPPQAWAAEARTNAAEMRAYALANRAEYGMLPGMRMNVFVDGLQNFNMPAINLDGLRDLNRQLENMPHYELRRVPAVPSAPAAPAAPASPRPQSAVPASPIVPAAPRTVGATTISPASPLPPVRRTA